MGNIFDALIIHERAVSLWLKWNWKRYKRFHRLCCRMSTFSLWFSCRLQRSFLSSPLPCFYFFRVQPTFDFVIATMTTIPLIWVLKSRFWSSTSTSTIVRCGTQERADMVVDVVKSKATNGEWDEWVVNATLIYSKKVFMNNEKNGFVRC